eukprot:CAMPEP_0113645754 /NCGR_PEP_ID=MMETSP0017_2-20120614/24131_1 /TAXON_ID=2856 /ORGANISM="Cylindrotheca closterium" /LENGTH=43 /DNA_ID=CAMNT_0000557535 /DNA_START=505 /DNA_END=636 /DNA_ORIENTATION=+ /assembly_acc=CAM_ASM_000147
MAARWHSLYEIGKAILEKESKMLKEKTEVLIPRKSGKCATGSP